MRTYFLDYEQHTLDRIKDREPPEVTEGVQDALSYCSAVINTLNTAPRQLYSATNPLPYVAARAVQSALAHDFSDLFLLTNILPHSAVKFNSLRQDYNSLPFRSAYKEAVQECSAVADSEVIPDDPEAVLYSAALHPCNAFLGMRTLFPKDTSAPLLHSAMEEVFAADEAGCTALGISRTQLLLSLKQLPNSTYLATPHNFVTTRSPLFPIAAALSISNKAALQVNLRYGRVAPGTYPAPERYPDGTVFQIHLAAGQETKYPGLRRLKMGGARYVAAFPYYLTALIDLCRLAEQAVDINSGATGSEPVTVLADALKQHNLAAFDSKNRGVNPGPRPDFKPLPVSNLNHDSGGIK